MTKVHVSSSSDDEEIEILEGMEGLLAASDECMIPPGSTQRLMPEEGEDDSPEIRRSIASVEERLLSFYNHQMEHVHDKEQQQQYEKTRRRSRQAQVQELPILKAHAYPCQGTHSSLPSAPSVWPQEPIMLRPTPLTQTKIRGIRRAHDKEYQDFAGFCAGCILPINTGKELPGESLVIDFETKHFVGTLLMRIKDAPSLKGVKEGETSYFDDKKRRFQAVVKGKFKTKLKMSECVTGQVFYRPAGSLPAKWVVTSFVKFVSTLAPQLEASIDGQEPRFLTPLVATAHTVLEKHMDDDGEASSESSDCVVEGQVEEDLPESDERLYNYNVYAGAQDIEAALEEPPANDAMSLMKHVPNANLTDAGSVKSRQKVRKKAFNAISAHHADEPVFELGKEYSFEFYQHLLVFGNSLAIDMGRPIGQVALAPITDGQPLKFMSAHKNPTTGDLDELWSFDIWHESLFPYAQAADEGV